MDFLPSLLRLIWAAKSDSEKHRNHVIIPRLVDLCSELEQHWLVRFHYSMWLHKHLDRVFNCSQSRLQLSRNNLWANHFSNLWRKWSLGNRKGHNGYDCLCLNRCKSQSGLAKWGSYWQKRSSKAKKSARESRGNISVRLRRCEISVWCCTDRKSADFSLGLIKVSYILCVRKMFRTLVNPL